MADILVAAGIGLALVGAVLGYTLLSLAIGVYVGGVFESATGRNASEAGLVVCLLTTCAVWIATGLSLWWWFG